MNLKVYKRAWNSAPNKNLKQKKIYMNKQDQKQQHNNKQPNSLM